MNKKQFILFALVYCMFTLALLPKALAQSRPRLAILPFTGGSGGDGETIAELFSFEPEIERVFVRIPRTSSIEAIMKEQQFQRSTGLTDSDTIARLGKQLNADYVAAGHIQVLGNSKLVLITIIHVESLQQIAGDYAEYKIIDEVDKMIPVMARRIAQSVRINRTNMPRLAVLPFALSAPGVNQSDAEVLAQLLATEMANSGKYAVLPRTSQIQSVMKEHQIQRSGLTDSSSIRVIGHALNAQYVLAGNVRSLGQINMFTAQVLDVESASLIIGDRENYSAVSDGLTKMSALGKKLSSGGTAQLITSGEMVLINGGSFMMGSPASEAERSEIESYHEVMISPFFIDKTEVTQKDFEDIMGKGKNPSYFKGSDLPVECVSWYEAIDYCNKRSQKEGLTPAYIVNGDNVSWDRKANGYRLPTEAEWEYASRAGTNTPFNTGNNITTNQASYNGNSPYNKNTRGSSLQKTNNTGSFPPNIWGLYDMHGNVSELCWDWYGAYSFAMQIDPIGPASGNNRVFRGGSWSSSGKDLRSAARNYGAPSYRSNNLGFRIIRSDGGE